MKKLFFILFLLAAGYQVQAQQEFHYTQFMYNKLLINPGYAGARGIPFLTALYRNQWIGFDGAPKSALVSFNSPFLTLSRVGIGVTVAHRQIGLDREFYASLAYSYDVVSQEDFSLRAGVMGSVRSMGIDFTKANQIDLFDQSIDNKKVSEFLANVGAGLYATFSEQFYVGLSVPRINANKFGLSNNQADNIAKERQHYYAMAGGSFPLSEDINLQPNLLLKYVHNAPFDMDLNMNLEIRKKVTAGISYRLGGDGPGESIDLLAFWQATPMIGVGAAYDFTLSKLRDYSAGSIELAAVIDLKKQKKNMTNPRFPNKNKR